MMSLSVYVPSWRDGRVGVQIGYVIDDRVVELDHRHLQLGDDKVLVGSRIADQLAVLKRLDHRPQARTSEAGCTSYTGRRRNIRPNRPLVVDDASVEANPRGTEPAAPQSASSATGQTS